MKETMTIRHEKTMRNPTKRRTNVTTYILPLTTHHFHLGYLSFIVSFLSIPSERLTSFDIPQSRQTTKPTTRHWSCQSGESNLRSPISGDVQAGI